MEEVLKEIIGKEKESESIIQEARKKAQEILRDADSRAAAKMQEAKDKAASLYSRRVAEAEQAAEKRSDGEIEGVSNLKSSMLEEKGGLMEELTDEIAGKVLSSDLDFS